MGVAVQRGLARALLHHIPNICRVACQVATEAQAVRTHKRLDGVTVMGGRRTLNAQLTKPGDWPPGVVPLGERQAPSRSAHPRRKGGVRHRAAQVALGSHWEQRVSPQVATRFQLASKAASLGTAVPMTVLWVDAFASQPSPGPVQAVLLAMPEEPATLATRSGVGGQTVWPATPAAAWAALATPAAKPAVAASPSSPPCRVVDPEPRYAAAADPKPHSKLPLPMQGALQKGALGAQAKVRWWLAATAAAVEGG